MAVEVKFCGLVRPADAAAAARSGAAYLGVIFAESPRRLLPDAARLVLDAGTRSASASSARRVGVFGRGPAADVGRIALEAELDIVQLHGDPGPGEIEDVRAYFAGAVWAVLRLEDAELPGDAETLAREADAIVIDAKAPGSLGGTGRALDWRRLAPALAAIRSHAPLVLAGGLTPENVAAAIALLQPDVVDVSSGVEGAPGVKDHGRMRAFAEAAGVLSGD